MSERRFPLGLLAIVPIVIGFGVYAFTAQAEVPDPNATPTATSTGAATATPSDGAMDLQTAIAADRTATAPSATPTASPVATAGAQAQRGNFREGAWVRVNAGAGDCLNARNQPSLNNEWVIVNSCLPHGFEGYVSGEAQQAEGHWWWFIAGAGWVAEDYLEYTGDVDIRARTLPELTGKGTIAFLREGTADSNGVRRQDIWLMNADGSSQRLLRAGPPQSWVYNMTWSPDSTMLAFTTNAWSEVTASTWAVHIMPVADPAAEIVIEAAFGVAWSPDGRSIGTIFDPEVDGMSGGAKGIPAIVEVPGGAVRQLSATPFWQQSAPAFNHDGSKLLLTVADYDANTSDDGEYVLVTDLAGNEIARITPPADVWYGRPTWSPVDDRIEFHSSVQGRPSYAVYDVARREIVASARVPDTSPRTPGKCGGWDMWTGAWSRDGRSVLYGFDVGDTGANGIWVWDVETGAQSLVPAINTSNAAPGPDGYFAFSSYATDTPYIFIAAPTGGFPSILTDGHSPVWSR
jgi:Tol biopolymer transport system component